MKKLLIALLLALSINTAKADQIKDYNPYHDVDHFSWQDYDDDIHIMSGFAISLTTGLIFQRYAKLPTWQSALYGTLIGAGVGIAKEVFFDNFTSRTDIKCWMAGGAAGGLTLISVSF